MSTQNFSNSQQTHAGEPLAVAWQEQLSAWADGQLGDTECREFWWHLQAQAYPDEVLEQWSSWHLVGDVLRAGNGASVSASAPFVFRLREALAQEPVLEVPAAAISLAPAPGREPVARQGAEAVNGAVFRWKVAAGFASLAAVAAIGWSNLAQVPPAAEQGAQLAQIQEEPARAPVPVVVAGANRGGSGSMPPALTLVGQASGQQQTATVSSRPGETLMIRDARLDELLARQYGNTVALQPPAAFLRNTHLPTSGIQPAGAGR